METYSFSHSSSVFKKIQLFDDFFESTQSLINPAPISPESSLKFHWADWDKTCDLFSSFHKVLPKMHERFRDIQSNNLQLINKIVWINRNGSKVQTNMRELFSYYGNPLFKGIYFKDSQDEILVSESGGNGTFVPFSSVKSMNENQFLLYIYSMIMENKMPQRQFRLRCDDSLNPMVQDQIFLHQVSSKGIIVKIKNDLAITLNPMFKLDVLPLLKELLLLKKENNLNIKEGPLFLEMNSEDLINLKNKNLNSFIFTFLTWEKILQNNEKDKFHLGLIKKLIDALSVHFDHELKNHFKIQKG